MKEKKKRDFLKKLRALAAESEEDPELAHMKADLVLLEAINDRDVSAAYDEVVKSYDMITLRIMDLESLVREIREWDHIPKKSFLYKKSLELVPEEKETTMSEEQKPQTPEAPQGQPAAPAPAAPAPEQPQAPASPAPEAPPANPPAENPAPATPEQKPA